MNRETELVTLGLAPESFGGIVNIPPCRASTILFNNLADFEAGERGEWPLPVYGRYGNPTQLALESALATLDGAEHAITFQSGMAAIASSLLAFVQSGDHVLIADTVYSPTRRFCDQELKKFNVEATYYDPAIGAGIAALMRDNTKVVYLESPGSLTFEVQDISAIAAEAKKRGAVVISDNTWATPLHFRPFEHGIDVSMHSATKYICGHSDVLMGVLTCNKAHYKTLLYTARNLGSGPSADDCYLALRGMRTMAVRMRRHQESTLQIATWLKGRPEVTEVYYPALPGAPGHALWKQYYTGACGLFSFQLQPVSHARLTAFINGLERFGLGYSWGGFESLIIPCNLNKIRTTGEWPHAGPLIRLHIGLEHPEDLQRDLDAALTRLKTV